MKILKLLLVFITLSISALAKKGDSIEHFAYHFQQTLVGQSAIANNSDPQYTGHNSFNDQDLKISLSSTFYLGFKLWKNGSFYINPDIAGGAGLGGTLGLAGYMNGEIFRVGNPAPSIYISRMYIRQYIPLSSEKSYVAPDANQLGEWIPNSRIQFTIGKITLADMFDNNHYSHDPRTRFLNWSLMNAGAYDFASNTKGYTWGGVVEYITPVISLRYGIGLEPQYSNGPLTTNRSLAMLDLEASPFSKQQGYGNQFEIEKPIKLKSGKNMVIRLLGFYNYVDAGKYSDAEKNLLKSNPNSLLYADSFKDNASYALSSVRPSTSSHIKYGGSLNIEKPIGQHVGAFSRLSWNDGHTESYAFAEIDRSESIGFVFHGQAYHRYHDRIEIAYVSNQISADHRLYLEGDATHYGAYGFMLGEPNMKYGAEHIIEIQYVYDLGKEFLISPDYQLIMNPGYDTHRGPISVIGLRTHISF